MLPRGSRRRRAAKAVLVGARQLRRRCWGHEDWSRLHAPSPARLEQQRQVAKRARHHADVRFYTVGEAAAADRHGRHWTPSRGAIPKLR